MWKENLGTRSKQSKTKRSRKNMEVHDRRSREERRGQDRTEKGNAAWYITLHYIPIRKGTVQRVIVLPECP